MVISRLPTKLVANEAKKAGHSQGRAAGWLDRFVWAVAGESAAISTRCGIAVPCRVGFAVARGVSLLGDGVSTMMMHRR